MSIPVVLGLARGGVPVAFEVAAQFRAPFDVCIVRQLDVPGNRGVAMGAVASERGLVLFRSVVDEFEVSEHDIYRAARQERLELDLVARSYRNERDAIPLAGRCVVLVDDGLASIAAPAAAIAGIRAQQPEQVVLAAPVARAKSHESLRGMVDALVCTEVLQAPHDVGSCYRQFPEVSDHEVRQLHAAASLRSERLRFPH